MRYPLSKSASASPDTTAAVCRMISGWSATNCSATPGAPRSHATDRTANGLLKIGGESTISTIVKLSTFRPNIPAAPVTSTFIAFLLVLKDGGQVSLIFYERYLR